MKNMIIAVLLAASPAAAQEFAAVMPAAGDLLAKTNALRFAAAERTINEALWNARQAYRTETNPGRKARMREDCDRMLDAILTRSGQAEPSPSGEK